MRRILLVEDDLLIARGTTRLIRAALDPSWSAVDVVHVTTAGAACEQLLGREPFDAIVSDFDLGPGGTGAEVFDWVATFEPSLLDRFMFLSGTDVDTIRKALTCRCSSESDYGCVAGWCIRLDVAVLEKPAEPNVFRAKLLGIVS